MIRHSILLLLLPLSLLADSLEAQPHLYISTNPVSYLVTLRLQDDLKRYLPIASGVEYGIEGNLTWFPESRHAWELRMARGHIHPISTVAQIHAGRLVFPWSDQLNWKRGLYGAVFAKAWSYRNTATEVRFNHAAPYLAAGYFKSGKRFSFDLRINQTLAIVSWSSLAHTQPGSALFLSPWPAFLPVIPTVTLSVGVPLSPHFL